MNYLEITGALVGLIYLWLEYRASIYLWIAGIIMPAIYIFVYYQAGLYADFGINIYYLLAAAYGWMVWMRGSGKETRVELPITHTPLKDTSPIAGILAGFFGIARILIRFTDSNVPLARLVHHGAEHHRHVDAGTQVRRTVVGMDRGRRGMLRTLHL